ncbi:MAG TPA: class I lanthipeptide [Frankiaceae bacterium]|jgi:hypothetical protein|nr:class I lanthipeptide [Frankiaceae bacterium]
MLTRRLTLAKETLAALTPDELRTVAGGPGTHLTCYTGLTDCDCNVMVEYSAVAPTECCQGIPTFHRAAC